jgi:predicted dehydrogenase
VTSLEELAERSDGVIVAAPTSEHRRIGEYCLSRGLHVLMEKPLSHDVESARRLVDLAQEADRVLMVGHVERYNPAVQALFAAIGPDPDVISLAAQRLAPFDGSRCLDVDVLYDLLIHDIDLALEAAHSPPERVSAWARPVFSHRNDVAHARIDFADGCSATFWTDKCSPRKVRTFTVTTANSHLQADTLANTLVRHAAEKLPEMEGGVCFMQDLRREELEVASAEPLQAEFDDFLSAITERGEPIVSGPRALKAMEVLELIRLAVEGRRDVRVSAEHQKAWAAKPG